MGRLCGREYVIGQSKVDCYYPRLCKVKINLILTYAELIPGPKHYYLLDQASIHNMVSLSHGKLFTRYGSNIIASSPPKPKLCSFLRSAWLFPFAQENEYFANLSCQTSAEDRQILGLSPMGLFP